MAADQPLYTMLLHQAGRLAIAHGLLWFVRQQLLRKELSR